MVRNEIFALAQPGNGTLGWVELCPVYTKAREVFYFKKPGWDKRPHVCILEDDTYYISVMHCVFIFCLTPIFIQGKSDNNFSVSYWSQPISLSHPCSLSLFLWCPPSFIQLSLSIPHCQCREHSCSHRPLRGNTQQTRKMTARAISFSEGLQVSQEMAIIPSTLSVLSYFLL